MKKIDVIIPVLFVIALVVIYFFWGCDLDLYVTVLIGIILSVTCLTAYVQNKKINSYEKEFEKLNEGNK